MDEQLARIKQAVVGGKHGEIEALVRAAVDGGVALNAVIEDSLISAMDVMGQKFSTCEIYVPELLVSALTMKKGMEILKPFLTGDESERRGTILMGTVKGDLHDIGKNLVIMMLEGAGFTVIDLGVDLTVERVVDQVIEVKPEILGLSALLTTTMPEMKKVIERLGERGLRDAVKVIVGGAPVDAQFAERIGADGYGKDGTEAVELARRFTAGIERLR